MLELIETYAAKAAAAATENQKKLVSEVRSAATSTTVIKEVCKKIDSDQAERERKKCNIMISNVPEQPSGNTAKEQKEGEIKYLLEEIDMERSEIVTCFRTGAIRKDNNGVTVPRPLIVVTKSQERASYWHDNGKGFRSNNHWINPDLCRADHEAQFFVRKERRERSQAAQNNRDTNKLSTQPRAQTA